ncbi:hypothetical protein AC249_AIPGENE27078 [Exaiptasia diaphana]|nr:hypothetical protein AC249_AIPGENE27078 [Exaiptasia diaphana]
MAPSQTFLRIPLILLLIFPVVSDATNSTSSKNTTKSASESQTNDAAKCLKSLNDVKRELTSTVPPLHGWTTDNYNNISRALFPGVKLPSLYIKVTLQFIVNDTGPGTGKLSDEVLKFTWSQSCIFVSNVCLNAKTVFSLGTVYPQRRETELVLSSHKLCEDNSETYWIYALLGLQDIAIIPNVSDPRVNTAQCVVPGHEGDKEQPLNVTNCNPDEWCKCSNKDCLLCKSARADGNDTCMVILQLFVSFIAICLAVFTVLISFFGRNVADIPTNNIFEIIMAAVLLWAIKNSGLAPDNNDNGQGRRQGNGQGTEIEMQTEQDRQQEPLVTIG